VTWSSDDDSVATVSSAGVVTPVAAGSATITVKTVDGNKEATCSVTVLAQCVLVTGVTLNKDTLTVAVGGSEQLSATIAPQNATNQNVTWSSNHDSIASVSAAGVVTGVSAGNAIITITTDDGSFEDTCAVTVKVVTAGTISCTIDNWDAFLTNHQLSTAKVQFVIVEDANDTIVQQISDTYTVGNDGSFTLTPNAVPSSQYLYDIGSISWGTLTVSPTSGVKLLDGPTTAYYSRIVILDDSDNRVGGVDVSSTSSNEGEVMLWYADKSCSVSGSIVDNGTKTFPNGTTFPAGWSFLIFTPVGNDRTASVATSGDSWYCFAN
jgi:hypothetical protein